MKTVIQYKNSEILDWGKKAKVLEQCLGALNKIELFGGSMKLSTLKDRWRRAEKAAEEIMGDEEEFVELTQNRGGYDGFLPALPCAGKVDEET